MSETYTGPTYIQGGTLALARGLDRVVRARGNDQQCTGHTSVLDISQAGNQTVQNLESCWNGQVR